MKLIQPQTVRFVAKVTEDELKERLAAEVLDSIGALGPDGKPALGVTTTVRRGQGRAGGYTIEVSGPMPGRLLAGHREEAL